MPDAASHRQTDNSEREQIITALIEVVAEHGYEETTVDLILDRANLDQAAFDRYFRDKRNCFLTVWHELNEDCVRTMVAAYESRDRWPDRLRTVAYRVVDGLLADPGRAYFGLEVLAAGAAARARRDMTMRVLSGLIDAGRNEMEDPESMSYMVAEGLAGAAYGRVYLRIMRDEIESLPDLIPELMSVTVLPYLGIQAAIAELSRKPDPPIKKDRNRLAGLKR